MCVPEFSMSPDLLGPNFDDYHVVVHDVPDVGRQAEATMDTDRHRRASSKSISADGLNNQIYKGGKTMTPSNACLLMLLLCACA